MMYNHAKNAGNIYDVFKHARLLEIVEEHPPKIYFESHCGFASYNKPEGWESSWMKVYRKTKCKCILCDIDPDVGKTVPPQFTFKNTDGFSEAHLQIQSGSPDFFFIDPPYVDDQDWILTKRLVKSLQKTNIKWAVWYPLFTHMESVFNQYTTIELHQKESDKIYGCGIAFGNFKKNWR